jgi:enterochelin esterase family protein
MIEGPEISFVVYEPNADKVLLVGEFDDWGRSGPPIAMIRIGGTGIFYHILTLTEPARLEYKFVVNGEWKTDPCCPNSVDNGVGGQNSFFETGDFHEPPELQYVAEIPHGRVEQFAYESERLANERQVHVYLPAAYGEDPERRFPSFYVHDGGEYLDRARMTVVLDNLIHAREIPPLIAVMIDPVNRMREYWANDEYAAFLCSEFVPEIDRRYHTMADRKSRGVMGASLGGLISVCIALEYPRVFSKAAGQSSALQLAEDKISSLIAGIKGSPMRFYFDVGKFEPPFIPANQRFAAVLATKRIPCFYQELPGGHNWTSWRAHLKDLLVFLWNERPRARRVPAKKNKPKRAARTPRRSR